MRIAFVGKGGSGKSTLSAVFSLFLKDTSKSQIHLFDADLNIHAPELIFGKKIDRKNYLSGKENKDKIFNWLLENEGVIKKEELKKTSTPTSNTNIFNESTILVSPLSGLCLQNDNLSVYAVGTYDEGEVGASCYHNNLSVLETILNFVDDKNLFIVADMVAGVDAFAGTMHAQFDMSVLIVEPTKRSLEVYEQYKNLAKEAGVEDSLFVIGNKVQSDSDRLFLENSIPVEKFLGHFLTDEYLRDLDKTGEILDYKKLREENKLVLKNIFEKLTSMGDRRNERLQKIRDLHKKYVSQAYVVRAHGDLSGQIDNNFRFK